MASRSSVVLCAFAVAFLLLAAAEVHASARETGMELDGRETKPGTEKDVTDNYPIGWPTPTYPTYPAYPSPPH